MHDIVRDELERHLAGKASPAFYSHLSVCAACREEVDEMEELGRILQELSPALGEAPQPSLGFYSKVAGTIREQQRSPFGGLFSQGSLFFRRVAFASLLLLIGFGSLLIDSETNGEGPDAAAIMAQYDSATSHAGAAEPNQLLVTLAAYHE